MSSSRTSARRQGARLRPALCLDRRKTLFRWSRKVAGLTEARCRSGIYFAAVCRCFPGKKEGGGDRVPSKAEIVNCAEWFERELTILKPRL